MLSFPFILTVIFLMAGGLLGVILLVVLLPRRDGHDPAEAHDRSAARSEEWQGRRSGRNGDRLTR